MLLSTGTSPAGRSVNGSVMRDEHQNESRRGPFAALLTVVLMAVSTAILTAVLTALSKGDALRTQPEAKILNVIHRVCGQSLLHPVSMLSTK